jgi:hypothetical protein
MNSVVLSRDAFGDFSLEAEDKTDVIECVREPPDRREGVLDSVIVSTRAL